MGRQSLFDRYSFFVAAAIIGAAANTMKRGFRQNDVRTFIEVFSNWVDATEETQSLPIQNTQISRYLEELVANGFARVVPNKSRHPVYRVTRSGLLEMASRITGFQYYSRKEHFYFVFFFAHSYGTRVMNMVKSEGKLLPLSLQLELETFFDCEALIDRQAEHVQSALKRLDKRIQEQIETQALVDELTKQGASVKNIIDEVDKAFPYGINSYRRYSEMLSAATDRQKLWEVKIGNSLRVRQIWAPARRHLLLHLEELEKLRKDFSSSFR